MKRYVVSIIVVLLFSGVPNASSQKGMALSVQLGTLGAEVGFLKSITPKLNGRIAANFLSYSLSGESGGEDPVAYDVDLKLLSFGILADYYPFANGFRLSGGLLLNNNLIKASADAVKNYTFDEDVYTPEDIGTLTGKVKPGLPVTPYIGIGLGNPVGSDKKIGFFMDLGIVYQGSPDVTLEADKDTMIYPSIKNEEIVEEDLKGLQIHPVLQIGMSFKL